MPERSIYEQLTGVKVDDTTLEQLDFTKNSFIDTKSIEYWKGIITVSKILEASRTYPHGLTIPESGKVAVEAIAAGASGSFQPPGTEVWQILGIEIVASGGNPVVNVYLTDGSTPCLIHTGTSSTTASSFNTFKAPFTISNTLYLSLVNADPSNVVAATIAYSKVSL